MPEPPQSVHPPVVPPVVYEISSDIFPDKVTSFLSTPFASTTNTCPPAPTVCGVLYDDTAITKVGEPYCITHKFTYTTAMSP
jgi:hypothetical protein